MASSSLKHLLVAPPFTNYRKADKAGVINGILLTVFIGAVLFIFIGSFFSHESKTLIIFTAFFAIASIIGLKIILNFGYVRFVGCLLSLIIWLSFTIPMIIFDGIRDASLSGYFVVLTMTGLMLGSRMLTIYTFLTIAAVTGVYIAESIGIITSSLGVPPEPLDLATFVVTLCTTSVLTGVSMHKLNESYERIRLKEKDLSKANDKLEQTLSKIKTLRGLIPICSACKKIRDDRGYWSEIEAYINKHSGAEFSHGICPKCAVKLYPELFKDE